VIYWDTSCVAKLYTQESDTALWERHALDEEDGLVASALMRTEIAFAMEQKEARGDIFPGAARALLRNLDRDIKVGRFLIIPVGMDVLDGGCDVARECYHADPSVFVRTLDGIHLATARLLKCRQLATADARMRDAAGLLGFDLL